VGLGAEAELRTGAGTGFFIAGALAAGAAGIGFFMGALADILYVLLVGCVDGGSVVFFKQRNVRKSVV
jgi:hypothetical protein